jgi:hypothetical protein
MKRVFVFTRLALSVPVSVSTICSLLSVAQFIPPSISQSWMTGILKTPCRVSSALLTHLAAVACHLAKSRSLETKTGWHAFFEFLYGILLSIINYERHESYTTQRKLTNPSKFWQNANIMGRYRSKLHARLNKEHVKFGEYVISFDTWYVAFFLLSIYIT